MWTRAQSTSSATPMATLFTQPQSHRELVGDHEGEILDMSLITASVDSMTWRLDLVIEKADERIFY
jgi:hypothetical protein